MTTPKRETSYTITRRYAHDPAPQAQALLRLLGPTPKNVEASGGAIPEASHNVDADFCERQAATTLQHPSSDDDEETS